LLTQSNHIIINNSTINNVIRMNIALWSIVVNSMFEHYIETINHLLKATPSQNTDEMTNIVTLKTLVATRRIAVTRTVTLAEVTLATVLEIEMAANLVTTVGKMITTGQIFQTVVGAGKIMTVVRRLPATVVEVEMMTIVIHVMVDERRMIATIVIFVEIVIAMTGRLATIAEEVRIVQEILMIIDVQQGKAEVDLVVGNTTNVVDDNILIDQCI
jgi:hypothetical protein